MVYFWIVCTLTRLAVLAVFVVAGSGLAGAAPTPTAPPAPLTDPWLIVPGQSLGLRRLGTPVATLYQAAGWAQPDRTHVVGTISYQTYNRQGVTVAVRDQTVVMMLTTNERFRTERGVMVGKTAAVITAAYGPPPAGSADRTRWYDDIGLVVVVGGNTIVRLGVYDPKTLVRMILAEERPARDVFLTARQPVLGPPPDAKTGAGMKSVLVTITLKNTAPAAKVLNPNFLMLVDRTGHSYRYHPSTFGRSDACRSTLMVRPGESASCSVLFVIPSGETPRSIAYSDGASLDDIGL